MISQSHKWENKGPYQEEKKKEEEKRMPGGMTRSRMREMG